MDEKIFSASDLVRIICKNIEDEKQNFFCME